MIDKNKGFRTTRGYELQNRPDHMMTSSMEDYLEMIYRLSKEEPHVRVSMVSQKLNVKPSSVSKMNRKLVEMGYISIDLMNGILLTEKGKKEAAYLFYRHEVIEDFLNLIGSKDPLLETELLEHTLFPETVEKIHKLMLFFDSSAEAYAMYLQWLEENQS